MKNESKSLWQLTFAMAIFGTIAPLVRRTGLPSSSVALFRALLAVIFVAAFLLIRRKKLPVRQILHLLPLVLLSGAALGFNWILLFEAYRYTSVSVATLSYYFAPVIILAVSPLLFREKLTGRQILCFCASTVGLVLITVSADMSGSNDLLGIGFGLGAAVLYAAVVLLNKRIRQIDGISRTAVQFAVAVIVLLPYTLLTDGIHLNHLDPMGWLCLLTVGLVHTGFAYCMYFSSIGQLPGQKVAILSYIDPLVAVLLSVTALGETMQPLQYVGGALILGFTLLNEIWHTKK